jgi:hypothetical protein
MKLIVLILVLIVAALSLFVIFKDMTGAQVMTECPEGFILHSGYCIDPVCTTGQVICHTENNFMMPVECTCVAVMGKFLCGIERQEETAVKSPLCVRRGQLGTPCGHYDQKKDLCVPNS